MNPYVRDRINRRLDALSDERLYQVLDYVEFLEAKYAEKAAPPASALQRFVDGVEDSLRAGGVAAGTVAETMGLLSKAVGVLGGVAQTTVTVATGVASAARAAVEQVGAPAPGEAAASAPAAAPAVSPSPAAGASPTGTSPSGASPAP